MAAHVKGQAQLLVYDLTRIGKPRGLLLGCSRWTPPSGRWSPPASPLHGWVPGGGPLRAQGEAVACTWSLRGSEEFKDRSCPGVWPDLTQSARNGNRVFDYVANQAWLVGGDAIVNCASGRLVANLGGEAVNQWFSDEPTLHLRLPERKDGADLAALDHRPDRRRGPPRRPGLRRPLTALALHDHRM